jgi:hypothetical protein
LVLNIGNHLITREFSDSNRYHNFQLDATVDEH